MKWRRNESKVHQQVLSSKCSEQADVPGRWTALSGEPVGVDDLERLGEGDAVETDSRIVLAEDGNEWYRYFFLLDKGNLGDIDAALVGRIAIESVNNGGWFVVDDMCGNKRYESLLYRLAMEFATANGGIGLLFTTLPARICQQFVADPSVESVIVGRETFMSTGTGELEAMRLRSITLTPDQLDDAKAGLR